MPFRPIRKIVGNHGLFSDIGVQLLAGDMPPFSETEKVQILIVNSADTAGKTHGNYLSPRVISGYYDIFNGKAMDTNWFIRHRIRYQLGLPFYRWISADQTESAIESLRAMLGAETFSALVRNINFRFRNLEWSFLQEMTCDKNGLSEFLNALRILNSIAETHPKTAKVHIVVEPSFLGLSKAHRISLCRSLKDKLTDPNIPEKEVIGITQGSSDILTVTFKCR